MDVRMWTKRIALVALALFVAGCGPKTEEVGGAIMIATPLALLAMILPTLILRKVSRLSPRMSTGRDFSHHRRDERVDGWRPTVF